jgi:hypothetical protein
MIQKKMIDIETLHQMWEEDSSIDEFALDETSRKGANLHSKYLELYNIARLTLKKRELELTEMREKKKRYYGGKMTQEEMDQHQWPYDPFQGESKPLKSDMPEFINSDSDIQKIQIKIEYAKVVVEALKEILDTLRWRHQTIRNIIEWRKFEAGN